MKQKILTFISIVGLLSLFASCEKDEVKVILDSEPTPPVILSMPESLILQRTNATNTVLFTAKAIDPGFTASANYFFEAAETGTDFANPVTIYAGAIIDSIQMQVSALNSILLKAFEADMVTSADFRIRGTLVVDGGTGAPGTGNDGVFEYISEVTSADVSPYGLPRLDLIGSGMDQKIESANGDGVYTGYVKLNSANAFTLLDPDTDTEYGKAAAAGTLEVDGAGISIDDNGWHILTADVNTLTYATEAYMIGLVGSATPNGWDAPDSKMDYDPKTGTWSITIELIDGYIKFRKNDGWAWNLGGDLSNLTQGGSDIPVTAGNYTITLTIINDETGSATIVKN
ncbi:MAG: SusE domain-containing protein [Tenuifilaceae bacterium]|jgi:hypothetical protein|nr:SusE domain-containing protein [Tenuifilaceae bacterium]